MLREEGHCFAFLLTFVHLIRRQVDPMSAASFSLSENVLVEVCEDDQS